MLMYLHTGYRPSKYMFAMMAIVANGGDTLEGITPILRERERRCALARESQRKRNAKKRAEKMKQQTSQHGWFILIAVTQKHFSKICEPFANFYR